MGFVSIRFSDGCAKMWDTIEELNKPKCHTWRKER